MSPSTPCHVIYPWAFRVDSSVCLRFCVCAFIYVQMNMHTCVKPGSKLGRQSFSGTFFFCCCCYFSFFSLSSSSSSFFFEIRSHRPSAEPTCWAGWQGAPNTLPVITSLVMGPPSVHGHIWLFKSRFRGLNSGPPACRQALYEPSCLPSPCMYFFMFPVEPISTYFTQLVRMHLSLCCMYFFSNSDF